MEDDFLSAAVDAVHRPSPSHLVGSLQGLRYAFSSFHLVDNHFQTVLCLLVQIRQIGSQFTMKNQIGITDRMMLFEIVPMHPVLFPDEAASQLSG